MSISVLFSNLVGLFLLIGVGFCAVRAKLVPGEATGAMTSMLMKITLPATVFSSMIRPFDQSFLWDALLMVGLAIGLHLGYIVLCRLALPVFRVPQGRRGMWMVCSIFCNNGFMGFPVAYALFGDEGLALAVMLGMPITAMAYSIGAKMAASDRQGEGAGKQVSWGKVLLSGVNFGMALGLVFYCLQIPVPQTILDPIDHLANMTTPLSMLITGMNLAKGRLTDALRDREVASICFMRLLLLPVLTWAVVEALPISNPLAVGVAVIITAMPSAAVSVALGEEYDGCVELGARAVFVTSLFCVVTIPLVALLLNNVQ